MAKRWKVDRDKRAAQFRRCDGWDGGCFTVAWLKASKEAEIAKRDALIRDLLERRCRQSCADCEHDEDDGCEFMRRALEMGVEVFR